MYLLLQHCIFKKEITSQLGSTGFAILSYILYESRQTLDASISIAFIMDFLNIKQHSTVRKYLKSLMDLNLITISEDVDAVDKHKRLFISLEDYFSLSGGFRMIPISIFLKYLNEMNLTTWLIFCTLSKLYHPDKECTKIALGDLRILLSISDKRTVSKNIKLLENLKLIEIKESDFYFNSSKEKMVKEPNEYIVKYLYDFYKKKKSS
jgi:hypothetical protein